MKRGPLRRKGWFRRKRDAAKAAKRFARQFHSVERVEWIEFKPCAVCGKRPCENHHIETRRHADWRRIVPLCNRCHGAYHGLDGVWRRHVVKMLEQFGEHWAEVYARAWDERMMEGE